MKNIAIWATIWLACGAVTALAAVFARRSTRWVFVGRVATGVLFTFGGALLHIINLAQGEDYADFADPAHFAWVTDAWRAVVPANAVVWIGLLALFEATVGVLAFSGGRRTQLGYAGVLAFYSALWLFGWFETIWIIAMIPAVAVLLWAERRAVPAALTPQVQKGPLVHA